MIVGGIWLHRFIARYGIFLAATNAFGFGEPISALINRIRGGEYPRDMALTMSAREFNVRNQDDSSKAVAAQEGVQLAAAIMATRDPNVDVSRYPGRLPPFDYGKYGIRPFITVVDPDLIEDPVVRLAYRDALRKHQEFLSRWSLSSDKQLEADYCIARTMDIVESAIQKEVVATAALEAIANLQEAEWIKGYIRGKISQNIKRIIQTGEPALSRKHPESIAAKPQPITEAPSEKVDTSQRADRRSLEQSADDGTRFPLWAWLAAVAAIGALCIAIRRHR